MMPILILGAGLLTLVVVWFLLASSGQPPPKAGFESHLVAAEAGDRAALAELARIDLPNDHLANDRRIRLAAVVKPLLVRTTAQEVLSSAMQAAAKHGCAGLALPTLELFRSWPALPEVVGGPERPAELLARLAPRVPGREGEAERVLEGFAQLIDGDNAGRRLALAALMRLDDPALNDLPAMDVCLTSLQRALPDPACARTLAAMAVRLFKRPDLAKELGEDGTAWRNRLGSDIACRRRLVEIAAWLREHGSADRVADGLPRLEEHRRFLATAQQDLEGWLGDPAWSGPMGHPRPGIEELVLRVKQAQTANRAALGGAAFGAGKKR